MDSKNNERVLFLEEEVKSLSEELTQCQADKEFVWSLWKRLQVASPDLTQVVSLVTEREKQKAENKDKKVLEILQAKDYKIQELEQKVTAQELEINNQVQQLRGSEEECGLMKKELANLHHRLGNKSRQLKEVRKQAEACEEEGRRALLEARNQLDAQSSSSQAELEKVRDLNSSRVKKLEEEVFRSRQEVLEAQSRSTALSHQLSSVEQEVTNKEEQLCQLKRELQDLQCLYRQSVEHAGEQANLIQQLEGLNLDTQRVLRSQEEAHTADTVSYQKLYNELSVSYQALWHSDEQLRQREAALSTQLSQRDQQIQELRAQLQSFTAAAGHCEEVKHKPDTSSSPLLHPQKEQISVDNRITRGPKTQQRSRSLSPGGGSSDRTDRQGQRIQRLQELLVLKTKENEDLRRAHARHHDRLRVIQSNYRTVTERLKEPENNHNLKRDKTLQLDSDEVWSKLLFYKEENEKLIADKADLEEELNALCLQAALDRVTVQDLQACLQEEKQELLFKELQEEEVKRSSTSIKTTARRVEQTFKKIEELQSQMVSLEREVLRLREENQVLREGNTALARERDDLQARVQLHQQRAVARKEAEEAQARAEQNRLLDQLHSFKTEAEKAVKAAAQARRRLLKLRQELGVLRAERDFHRSAAKRKVKALTLTNSRIRSRTAWVKASNRTHAQSKWKRMDSPTKDDWEDMSADSENEKYSDSLESRYSAQTRQAPQKTKGCRYMLICPIERPEEDLSSTRSQTRNIQRQGVSQQMMRKRKVSKPTAVLRQSLLSLKQQVAALQADRRAAQQLAAEQNQRQVQVDSLLQQLNASKQLSKKQACELAGLEQQKTCLQMELEQWRKIHQQTTLNRPAVDPEHLQAQVKQLTHRLKSANSEMSKHSAANKSLRAQLDERDQTLKELHERVSVLERDVTMKRQLVEDLRSRLKICQDSERSHRAVTEDLEKRIKILSEESANRKALVDSLKRRLTVATAEKKQHETTSQKIKDELQKKEQRVAALQVRIGERDQAMAELERAASQQMHGLAQQSTQAMEILQSKLALAESQLHQLRTVIQALANEVAREVQDAKTCLRTKRKRQKEGNRVSKCSLVKAASILNMTETDLVDMLDTDEESEEACAGHGADTDWTEHVQHILQQQIPSAGLLMDAMLLKMKEGKVLTEKLAALTAAVSKNA
ncbi:centlein isoform X2 [Myxocyprinus asiaticus]|uniref:centlein isoform X2 n=1 Tax=Myxocyprinus asiaticus TaxID=70543 RepID=UPI0022219475|nr:centlein isoform X2 [Myxocyprinus asiaticus]